MVLDAWAWGFAMFFLLMVFGAAEIYRCQGSGGLCGLGVQERLRKEGQERERDGETEA